MSRGTLKYLLAISLLLNLTVLATAGYLHFAAGRTWLSPFGTKMGRDRFLFEQLSLTADQMKAMREKAIPFRAEIDRRRSEIVAQRKALIGLLRAETPDQEAIDATIVGISALQQTMQRQITRQMLEQKALLGRDQQQAFLDLIDGAMARGGDSE